MKEQIDSRIKEKRSKILLEISDKNQIEYNKEYIGKEAEVLFEEKKNGFFEGHTKNYIRVKLKTNEELYDKIRNVKIIEQENLELIGTI